MTAEADLAAPEQPVRGGLNQPRRAIAGAAEIVVTGALVWLAFWLWSKSGVTVTQSFDDGRPPYVSHRLYGHWMALSILSATVAGILLVDAIRQFILAVQARPGGKGRRRK
ncbi:hypothetical protein [Actinocrispum sp. NPDC049592]|uniref:hypothetical protein n=1 Tax=Actinocrispum sp. NPDC049592 TaxID=3154835 RepID=UPI0034138974